MATSKIIKGVTVSRHDTAINWAKATRFVPKDGELIVFTADDVPLVSTTEGPIWTSYYEGNLKQCVYNNRTNFTYDGTTQDLAVNTLVDGCMVDGTRVPYMNLDENGTYVDSGSYFNLTPSNKVRFKFGDGKTNVNLLPFIETGSSENGADVDLSNYYNKDETKAAIVEELNKYDSVALMEVTKTSTNFLELTDVYAIQSNATLKVTEGAQLAGFPINIYDHNLANKPKNTTRIKSDFQLTIGTNVSNGVDGLSNVIVDFAHGYAQFNITPNESIVSSDWCTVYDYYYSGDADGLLQFDGTKLQVGQIYKGVVFFDSERVDETLYNVVVNNAFLVQTTSSSSYNTIQIEASTDGTFDTSKLFYPYCLIINNLAPDTDCNFIATYDTEYKVDQNYNKDSVIPQSGTAVEDALNSLVTVMKGSSIDDITAAGVTSKVVILYED